MPRSNSNTSSSKGRRAATGRTEPVKAKAAARAPSIRGEKRVKATDASIPVGPPSRRRGTHDGPTDPAAVDRRREFTGTDQPAEPTPSKAPR